MKYYTYIHGALFLLFLFPATHVLAQAPLEKTIDSETYTYTTTLTELEGVTMYYNEDVLVFSEIDLNGDGQAEQWVVFDENTTVRKELRDSDGDGAPDITFTYSPEEELLSALGEGLDQYEQEIPETTDEPTETQEDPIDDTTDYAGDLSDIKKLAGESGGWWRWLLALCILGGGGYWYSKNKKSS
jgi:hypothetical protein